MEICGLSRVLLFHQLRSGSYSTVALAWPSSQTSAPGTTGQSPPPKKTLFFWDLGYNTECNHKGTLW